MAFHWKYVLYPWAVYGTGKDEVRQCRLQEGKIMWEIDKKAGIQGQYKFCARSVDEA